MNTQANHIGQHYLLIPVLGILPVLVAVSSLQTGLAMGLVFCCAYLLSTLLVLCSRPFFTAKLQWIMIVFISATVISLSERLLQTWFYSLSVELGMYLPLLAMNGLFIGGLQETVLLRKPAEACKYTAVILLIVFLFCLLAGGLREMITLPILAESAGLFLLVSLVLATVNVVANKVIYLQNNN